MITRLAAFAAALMVLVLAAAGQDLPGNTATVVRYVGAKQGNAWGKPVMIVVVSPRQGGAAAELVVPNKDPMAQKLDPDAMVLELVKSLKKGDLIEVKTSQIQGVNVLNFIVVHVSKPGEDDPHAFTFVELKEGTVAGKDGVGAMLEKDGKSVTVWAPQVKAADGKVAPDEEIAAAIKGFKKGDLVELRVVGSSQVIKSISPYQSPEKAEFVKLGEQKVGEDSYVAVELKKDGEAVTVLVPGQKNNAGKLVGDQELTPKAKGLKAGQIVEYKSRSASGQSFLVDIRPTGERAAASKPAAR